MFLSEPGRTNYDLNFRLLGFPVRIHPLFFVLPILFAAGTGDGLMVLVFAIVFFVSILIHELGHAVVMRYYGQPARIVLYLMGGLAIPDSGSVWSGQRGRAFTSQQHIIVSFAGPMAGFLLAIAFALVILAINGKIQFEMWGLIPGFAFDFSDTPVADALYLEELLRFGLLINVYLNLLNLAPVYPLDGGQIARQLLISQDAWQGARQSIILSIVVAAVIALLALMNGMQFIGILFILMAISNWMTLQQQSGGGFGGRPW